MLVYKWELPCFSEYNLKLPVNDSPSCKYLFPIWLSCYLCAKGTTDAYLWIQFLNSFHYL